MIESSMAILRPGNRGRGGAMLWWGYYFRREEGGKEGGVRVRVIYT